MKEIGDFLVSYRGKRRAIVTDPYGVVQFVGNWHEVVKGVDMIKVCPKLQVSLWEDVVLLHFLLSSGVPVVGIQDKIEQLRSVGVQHTQHDDPSIHLLAAQSIFDVPLGEPIVVERADSPFGAIEHLDWPRDAVKRLVALVIDHCVCVCVCARARARARVSVCVCANKSELIPKPYQSHEKP